MFPHIHWVALCLHGKPEPFLETPVLDHPFSRFIVSCCTEHFSLHPSCVPCFVHGTVVLQLLYDDVLQNTGIDGSQTCSNPSSCTYNLSDLDHIALLSGLSIFTGSKGECLPPRAAAEE